MIKVTDGQQTYNIKMRAAYANRIRTKSQLFDAVEKYFSSLPVCPNGQPAGWRMSFIQKLEYMGIIADCKIAK